MHGRFALRAEIFAGLDDADAEQHLPEAIDRDPRGQRVLRVNEPAGERQPIQSGVLRQRRQDRRHAGRDLIRPIAIIAAPQHEGLARLCHLVHHHRRDDGFVERLLFCPQALQLGILPAVSLARRNIQKVIAHLLGFILRAFAVDRRQNHHHRIVNG